jgi:hypothetical protein
MGALIRFTLPLVAYLCVGTVISAILGYGYLRQTGKLNDETVFRITALLHGIDLAKLAEEGHQSEEATPPEEPSFAEQQAQSQAMTLRFEEKQKQLENSLRAFDNERKRIATEQGRYTQLQAQVESYLEEQRKQFENTDLAKVIKDIELLIPQKQAKPILIQYIAAGEVEKVVQILGSMKERARKEILRTFVSEEEVKMLFQMQQHMLNNNPALAEIDEHLKKFNELKSEDQ